MDRSLGLACLRLAVVSVAALSTVNAATVYTSGTHPITTNTLISDYFALAGTSTSIPVATLGTGVTLTIGNGSATAFLLDGYDGTSLGFGNQGIFNMSGGTIHVVGVEGAPFPGSAISVGDANAVGQFNFSGGTIDLQTDASATKRTNLAVGTGGGTGTFTQTGGAMMLGTNFSVGSGAGSSGTYAISAGSIQGINAAGFVYVGDDGGVGEMDISGTADIDIGGTTGMWIGGDASGPTGSTGLVRQTGGTVTFTGNGLYLAGQAGDTGSYELNGGTLEIGGIKLVAGAGAAALKLGGGTLKVVGSALSTSVATQLTAPTTSTIDTNGFGARLTGGLSGSGALHKEGAGLLDVDGASAIGDFALNGGSATFRGNLTARSVAVGAGTQMELQGAANTTTDTVMVANGGTLVGSVSSGGDTTILGTQDLKRLSQSSSSGYDLGGTLRLDLAGGGFGSARLMAGSITLEDDATIVLYSTGALPSTGADIFLFDAADFLVGSGVQLLGEGSLAGYQFTLNSATGHVEAVPEPSTLALIAMAATAGVLVMRRRLASR